MDSERLKLRLAYDGRPFRGWQSQAGGGGVQDAVERAFMRVCGQRVVVQGSGRTDAGVHALGQIAHADVARGRLEIREWQNALNANLPDQIRVLKVTRAAADFHARFNARGKVYVYRIWNGPFLHPLEPGRAWHVPGAVDFAELRACATMLEGTHDFAGFAANRGKPNARRREKREAFPGVVSEHETSTVRTIRSIRVTRRGSLITLRFEGNGFLYKMVRLLTGTLLRCAQGRAKPAFLTALLEAGGARKTHFMAPAEGLYLARVLY